MDRNRKEKKKVGRGRWFLVAGVLCFPLALYGQVREKTVAATECPTEERMEGLSVGATELRTPGPAEGISLQWDADAYWLKRKACLTPRWSEVRHGTNLSAYEPRLPEPLRLADLVKREQLARRLAVSRPLVLPYFMNPSLLFRGDYSTSGVLFPVRYGALVGAGSQTTLPGIGRLNEASLGWVHSLGDRWTLQLGMQARKFSFPYAVGQHFATSGMLQYQAADRLAFRVFGSYTAGPSYGYSTHSYGGSMLLQLSDRFSLEAGVQRQYNPLRGGWETVPMLVPTYKFDKFELGLDVGGLLYQLLHEVVIDNDRMRMGNPTIGPPTTFPR